MPQLILDPWFTIFVSSWIILIFMAPKKLNSVNPNEPNLKSNKTQKYMWSWPWQ